MAYSYKCNLSFGLVFIPVRLVAAAKSNDIGFNMIDAKTMSRIKYVKTNANGDPVESGDIVKGYEYEDGKYVVFKDEEFDKLKTPKDKNIEIASFVSVADIDPVYFDRPFYVVPTGAEKAFGVLLKAMEASGKAGIAKTVLGTKETLIAIRAAGEGMALYTLRFADEIQANPYKCLDEPGQKELDLALAIIDGMNEKFDPKAYRDEYRERLLEAIQAKIDGREVQTPQVKSSRGISDLMEALQQSLLRQKTNAKSDLKKQAVAKAKKSASSGEKPRKKA